MGRAERVRLQIAADQIEPFRLQVEAFAKQALVPAAESIKHQVIDFTPRWQGGLIRKVKRRAENGGRSQLVYGEGVVFRVHEKNATWSKLPPHKPLRDWVVGKLHVGEDEADGIAWAIRKKIFERGLTLPNREKRGKQITRTKELMRRTHFHFQAFGSAMKQLLRRIENSKG